MSLLLGPSGPVSEVISLYLWIPHLRMENVLKTEPRGRVSECLPSTHSAVGLRSSTAKEEPASAPAVTLCTRQQSERWFVQHPPCP